MTLTKRHEYTDQDGDTITVPVPTTGFPQVVLRVECADDGESASAYVNPADAAAVALNVLGHDRPDDDPLATRFESEGHSALIAHSSSSRSNQLNLAIALLMAVDAYDRRAARLATAEERRDAAAKRLGATVSAIRRASNELTGDDIGKLREALGRYDAELSK